VDAGDIAACVLEIFDDDGSFPGDAPGGTFPGTAGCDANEDVKIDAGDIACTVLLVFSGPGACAVPTVHSAGQTTAALTIATAIPALDGHTVQLPVLLTTTRADVMAAAFALDYDPSRLTFDPTDANGDSLPDAIVFTQSGADRQLLVQVDAQRGVIKLFVGAVTATAAPFGDGVLAVLTFRVKEGINAATLASAVTFQAEAPVSLGDRTGQSLPVTMQVEAAPTRLLYLPLVAGE
jgi:hypothetical protein